MGGDVGNGTGSGCGATGFGFLGFRVEVECERVAIHERSWVLVPHVGRRVKSVRSVAI